MRALRGFTLMEMMVTVAIIGIIAAIAFPSYNSHLITTRRTAATACLTEMAQFMERLYTSSMNYSKDMDDADTVLPNSNCRNDLDDFYTLSLDADVQTFTISATPATQYPDEKCGILTIDQAGGRTANGSGEAEIRSGVLVVAMSSLLNIYPTTLLLAERGSSFHSLQR